MPRKKKTGPVRPRWDDDPPDAKKIFLKRLVLLPRQTLRVVCLSSQVCGVWTHHAFGRTVPCWGRDQGCPHCGPETSSRWTGYLVLYKAATNEVGFLPVSFECRKNCAALRNKAVSLRGKTLEFWRTGEHKNAPMRCNVDTSLATVEKLPKEINLREFLHQLWGQPFIEDMEGGTDALA